MLKLKSLKKPNDLIPILIWTAVFTLPFVSRIILVTNDQRNGSVQHIFYSFLVLIGLFYLHTYVIYPVRDKKNGKWYYSLILLACVAVFFILQMLFAREISPLSRQRGLLYLNSKLNPVRIFSIFPFIFVIFLSYCYRLYIDKIRQNSLMKELETVHLKTELDFLRSQISPHFMFNLMNTLVSMARKKSELMEPSLISLSQMMRYMLYDSDGAQISLDKEIEYLKNYVNLQLLRFGDDIRFNLFLSGNFEGYKMEPMLLIPFVENAFKHGVGTIKEPLIDVSVDMDDKKHVLRMMVMNSINEKMDISDKGSGIGLSNVYRRLELLYPDKHSITVTQKAELFIVNLEISL